MSMVEVKLTNKDLEWGKERARELHAQGVAPELAAREAAFEMEDRARRAKRLTELSQGAANGGLRVTLADLLASKTLTRK